MYPIDPQVARLMYVLFKKHVIGTQIMSSEMKETISKIEHTEQLLSWTA